MPNTVNFISAQVCDENVYTPIANYEKMPCEVREKDKLTERVSRTSAREELNVDEQVGKEEKIELCKLINEYRDCVEKNMYEIGKTDILEMKIEETPWKQIIKNIAAEWKDAGIVEETSSPYASPVLLVRKKSGEHRLVIDYKKLKAIEYFPQPKDAHEIRRFVPQFSMIVELSTRLTCKDAEFKWTSEQSQANGLVEKLNSTLLPKLQCYTFSSEDEDWDKYVKKIEQDINTTENKTTGRTLFEMLYGYIPRINGGQSRELTANNETYTLPKQLQDEVRQKIEEAQTKYKDRYDKHRYKSMNYEVGDIVCMKSVP
nr:unnamed protein product [Callosobruchus analis]